MRYLLSFALLLCGLQALAQNTIYSLAIGNWRSGSPVCITPVIETSEAMSKMKLAAQFREQYAELKDIADDNLDVLLFGTKDEADEKRASLQRSYTHRKLDVVLLDAPVRSE
mgnify:CR=1 FL=1